MSIDHQELWLIEQRDEAERKLAMAKEQIEYLRQREDALLKAMVQVSMAVNPPQPPKMLADKASMELGRQKGVEDTREQCAQLVETMGMHGYGALAMAAAIRKGDAVK